MHDSREINFERGEITKIDNKVKLLQLHINVALNIIFIRITFFN